MTARMFTQRDLEAFARVSGDHNPIHVDAVAARRLLFGGAITHGVYALLWVLDEVAGQRDGEARVASLRARFQKPIPVDAPVEMVVARSSSDAVSVRLELSGARVATVKVGFAAGRPDGPDVPDGCPPAGAPAVLSIDQAVGAAGSVDLRLDRALLQELFPRVLEVLAPAQAAALLASTRVVGMECPGEHSIYAELDCEFASAEVAAPMTYSVVDHDPRFARVGMELEAAGVRGRATAFFRPPPQAQLALDRVDGVADDEFAGQRALVVGGSRGLGEVVAKALAAGGASIAVTYFHGEQDAGKLVGEIASRGREAASLRWNVLDDPPDLRSALPPGWTPTHMYYLASPHIGSSSGFSDELFSKFCDYYVAGFVKTVDAVLSLDVDRLDVLYPSSVFVDDEPAGMAEYVAAKRAGEAACEDLSRQHANLRVITPRLPRMATDQTQSMLGEESPDPLPTMLGELRRLRDL